MQQHAFAPYRRPLSRRRVIASAGALAFLNVQASVPGAAAQSASPVASPVGAWVFTDDRGITVTLPVPPARLIAGVFAAAPLWDFGIEVDGIFGWNINADGTLTKAGGAIDPMAVAILNGEPNQLDAEQALAIAPDLIITVTFSPDDPASLWGISPDSVPLINAIAPVIALSGLQRADRLAARFADLAAALGADQATPALAAQRADYAAATQRLDAATAARPASAIFAYPEPDQVYLANPNTAADAQLFRHLGLTVLPETDDVTKSWIGVSYEAIGQFETDLFFYAVGEGAMSIEEIAAHPTLGQLPAVRDGHAAPWQQDVVFSDAGLTDILDDVAVAVERLG